MLHARLNGVTAGGSHLLISNQAVTKHTEACTYTIEPGMRSGASTVHHFVMARRVDSYMCGGHGTQINPVGDIAPDGIRNIATTPNYI